MPAEYAIDPTGVGRMLGLTQMGEIKEQLAEEAAADRAAAQAMQTVEPVAPTPVVAATVAPAPVATKPAVVAQPAVAAAAPMPVAKPAPAVKSDEISFTLVPGQGAEVKLEMKEGTLVSYEWSANGGKLNYDTHGDPYNPPKGFYHGYGKGRFQPGDSGTLEAAFDGKHGWFWRNRTKKDVVLTLKTEGDYIKLQRVL